MYTILARSILILIIIVLICISRIDSMRDHILFYAMWVRRKLHGKNYLLDNFDAAFTRNIPIETVGGEHTPRINAHSDAKNQYTLRDMHAFMPLVDCIRRRERFDESLERFMPEVLKHVHVNGRVIGVGDVVLVDVLSPFGAYFPSIHTDIEFGAVPNCNGFQVWYLLVNPNPTGNMFILDTPQVQSHTYLDVQEDKTLIVSQCGDKVLRVADPSIRTDGLSYLNAKEGDCFIFGKSLYHMSDPRNERHGNSRLAVNFRVIVRETDGGITLDLTDNCAYNTHLRHRIGVPKGVNILRIFPTLTELARMF